MKLSWLLLVAACSSDVAWSPAPGTPLAPPAASSPAADPFFEEELDPTLEALRRDAERVAPLVRSAWVKDFVKATASLPAIPARTLYHNADKTQYWPEAAPDRLEQKIDSSTYYNTKYGSPLAYARPLDLLAEAGMPSPKGASVVDFGYGTIGHLRLLAAIGARVTGVDTDPFLLALYSLGSDSGPFGKGSVRLLHGSFPSELGAQVGTGHRLWLSKNTLKKGYIHPEQEVPPKQTVRLGVTDEAFVAALAAAVAPGGYVMIYNITPPPNGPGLPYRTWADGRCPFARPLWEANGFTVLAFDVDDSAAARAQGKALGWDADGDLEKSIFAMYTLLRR